MPYTASANDFLGKAIYGARRLGGWIARAGFGFFVVMAAGMALLATTIVGVVIALAALLLKIAHNFGRSDVKPDTASRFRAHATGKRGESQGETLDAHRTPDGWVIEPNNPSS